MWTEENIEKLKELWDLGCSASHIAQRVGGTTRNAVLGKIHRLGLPKRQTARPAKERRVPSPRRRPMPSLRPMYGPPVEPADFVAQEVEIPSLNLTFEEISDKTCKFQTLDNPRRFCGQPTAGPLSWCFGHAKVVFQPAKHRQRKAVPA